MKNTKIHVMRNGEVFIDRALAYKEKTFHPMPHTGWLRGKNKKMWVPVSTYLIEHPKGLVLIDTGWHKDMRTSQRKHLSYFLSTMFKGKLPEGEAVDEKLLQRDIEPEDLDYVVLTHMHSDHVSGLKHVKKAKKILVSAKEWQAANQQIGYVKSMWSGVNLSPFMLKDIPFGPYKKGIDLFQDQSLYLVHTPGHSTGHLSVLVKVSRGWILLASDVGYSQKSWDQEILPGRITDVNQMRRSLRWVKEFSSRSDCAVVLANHDPSVIEHCIE